MNQVPNHIRDGLLDAKLTLKLTEHPGSKYPYLIHFRVGSMYDARPHKHREILASVHGLLECWFICAMLNEYRFVASGPYTITYGVTSPTCAVLVRLSLG